MNFKNFVFTFAGLWLCAFFIPTMFMYSCQKSQLEEPAGDSSETVIILEAEPEIFVPNVCNPEFEINTQWCMHPSWGGMFWSDNGQAPGGELEEECLNPNFETSFDYWTGIWAFRTALPVCTTFFEIPDSECEWLHNPYIWAIAPVNNFIEGTVQFPEEWADCVQEMGDEEQMWCFDVRMRVRCPE